MLCRAREENKEEAAAHIKDGDEKAAYACYRKAVDITPETANNLVRVSKQDNICTHEPPVRKFLVPNHVKCCSPTHPGMQ